MSAQTHGFPGLMAQTREVVHKVRYSQESRRISGTGDSLSRGKYRGVVLFLRPINSLFVYRPSDTEI